MDIMFKIMLHPSSTFSYMHCKGSNAQNLIKVILVTLVNFEDLTKEVASSFLCFGANSVSTLSGVLEMVL